ncbi:MAG TPA: hypothetical protein VGG30_04865 [Pirellulales bacterium]|jgi:hypothetical protein
MPKRSSKPSKEKDYQQMARSVLDQIMPDAEPAKPKKPVKKKNPAAVALGRLGGAKGGAARAAKLTPERRAEIAKKAAAKRWATAEES